MTRLRLETSPSLALNTATRRVALPPSRWHPFNSANVPRACLPRGKAARLGGLKEFPMRRRRFFLSGDATVEMPPPVAAPKLFDAELPQRQMRLDPILSNDTLAPLYGPRGLGKTFVALGMAWAAASGSSFLNWHAGRPLQDRRPRLLERGAAFPADAALRQSTTPTRRASSAAPTSARTCSTS
jgi:AAA domain